MSIRSLESIARRSSTSSALSVAFGLAFLAAGVAQAAPTSTLNQGQLSLSITALAPIVIDQLAPGMITASVSRGAGNSLTGVAFPDQIFSTAGFVLPVTDPSASPIKGVQATAANGAASFHATAGGFGGTMPLAGQNKVCLFGPCSAAVANISVPLNVAGVGGSATVNAAVALTVLGAPWTTGTAQIGTVTAMGHVSPVSSTGMASGTVSLVTPVFVSTNIGASAVVPIFVVMDLTIPEPGQLALMATSVAGLVAVGVARRRRRTSLDARSPLGVGGLTRGRHR